MESQNAAKLHERLEHIEKNLILQQPKVVEFTKQVYPHIEATIKRCEMTEERQTRLDEMIRQTEISLADFLDTTEETLAKQQKESNELSLLTQTKIINEFRGYQQLIQTDLQNLRYTEKSCQAMVAESRMLAKQFSRPYEMASETLQEMTETARSQLIEAGDLATKTMEESRLKFLKTFHRLDTTVIDSGSKSTGESLSIDERSALALLEQLTGVKPTAELPLKDHLEQLTHANSRPQETGVEHVRKGVDTLSHHPSKDQEDGLGAYSPSHSKQNDSPSRRKSSSGRSR